MKRLFAVVGLAAFIAACSDSNMTSPVSRAQPHGASFVAGNPPPPPLSGSGNGFASAGDEEGVVVNTPSKQCNLGDFFTLSYSLTFLQNNTDQNTVVHLTLDGSTTGTTGTIDLHQTSNGASDIHGHISNGSSVLDIQGGDGTITNSSFDFELNGMITDLSSGNKCKVTGSTNGTIAFAGP